MLGAGSQMTVESSRATFQTHPFGKHFTKLLNLREIDANLITKGWFCLIYPDLGEIHASH